MIPDPVIELSISPYQYRDGHLLSKTFGSQSPATSRRDLASEREPVKSPFSII